MAERSRRAVYGPERWRADGAVVWSHWDRWFAWVCLADFGGDWDALVDFLWARLPRGGYHGDRDVEAKTSHVADLRARLDRQGLDAAALAGAGRADGRLPEKARRKVLTQALAERDLTEPMRATPRRRLRERALRGSWGAFPVSPAGPYQRFAAVLAGGRRDGEWAAMEVVRELVRELAAADAACGRDGARRLATYRAFLTALSEAMERGEDGSGVAGACWVDTLGVYVDLPWERPRFGPRAYYKDLCELLVAQEVDLAQGGVAFRRVAGRHVGLVAKLLAGIEAEWAASRLGWQAERARVLTAELYVATGSLDRFERAARALGSEEWQPIVAMAEAAMERGDAGLARRVFAAADQPGFHQATLRRRCLELTGHRLPGAEPAAAW